MKPSYNQACLDYSDTAYSEQTLWNKWLEADYKNDSAVNEMQWECTIGETTPHVFSGCHLCLDAQTQQFTPVLWQKNQNIQCCTEGDDLQQREMKSKD